jgi:TRAP-type C4-dicarboxylate transport system substrate-binding protein
MTLSRRALLQATPALMLAPTFASAATELKISHQFPGGTLTEGDFRDRLCRRFAADVEKRTDGALKATVYPGSSLMKTNSQFSALRKGALDVSLVPLSYAGGEVAETNIGCPRWCRATSRERCGKPPRSASCSRRRSTRRAC